MRPFQLLAAVAAPLLMLSSQDEASAVVLSATESEFCTSSPSLCINNGFSQQITLSAGPGPEPGSDGVLTLEAFGDFGFPNESFNVNIEGYDLGRWLNDINSDDLISGLDLGNDYNTILTGTSIIPQLTLSSILTDGFVDVTFTTDSNNHIDDLYPGEFISFRLQYDEVSPSPSTSVPGPLPLFGVAAAFGYSRKLRRRMHAK